ncbi:MAG TPA: GNAT family N-acetyltransferase [Blastocatellia bacterium]|jgi:predicted acetyltransferase|nr:GNAT family N-acetyltransferase [Blastocatellia bacterium]
MSISRTTSALHVEVIPALPEQEHILANMLELYAHDFSEFIDLKLGADGRFGYKPLPLYWKESNRYPFLIMANGHFAGFVLVRRGSEISNDADVWDVTEFFIVRGFRRLGIGMRAAQETWKKFSGKWEVRVIDRNQKAKDFWGRAITEFLGKTIEPIPLDKNGEGWHVFSFESRRSA